MSSKMDTIWSKLDRKATAISEFTMRQYRTRVSTWAIMIAAFLALFLMLLFYAEAMNSEVEAIDNDNDGFFNEDDFDWDNLGAYNTSVGFDDDGDCTNRTTVSQRDSNDNNIECDIKIVWNAQTGEWVVEGDIGVDEDPDEEKYVKEAGHRAFILGIGKFGIVYLLGIFLPLFLATGLVREEMSSGTMHYMLAKPIARGEILLYRIIGYLGIVWPYILVICTLLCVFTGLMGPSDGFFRWSDIGVWMSIAWATMMVTLVYGMIFCTFGILWKNGVVLSIIFAVWELGMAFVALFSGGDSPIQRFSVIGWGLTIVDSGVAMAWPDNNTLITMGMWGGGHENMDWWSGYGNFEPLPGAEPLSVFSGNPGLGISNWLSFIISTLILIFQAAVTWFIGQAIFKGKEVD